jgi:hypothetical protein
MKMTQDLHCYYTDEHTVIAESIEDARQNWDEWTYTKREHYDDNESWEDAHFITQIPDEKEFSVLVEDDLKNKPDGVVIDGCVWRATAKAWAASQGRGYLCSVEF